MTPTEPHFDQATGQVGSNYQDELPKVITTYLKAHQARDLDTAIGRYTDDASVTDEGRTYNGPDEIRAWLSRSATEYTYTIEVTGATKLGDGAIRRHPPPGRELPRRKSRPPLPVHTARRQDRSARNRRVTPRLQEAITVAQWRDEPDR